MCNIVNHNMVFYPNGDVRLCCLAAEAVGNINKQTWQEVWNSKEAREHREQVAQGIPEGCKHCARYLDRDPGEEPVKVEGAEITHLDFRFDNLCNCKCIMCAEDFSSRFGRRITVSERGLREILNALEQNKDTLQHIHFAGGEPMISPGILTILEKIVELGIAGNITLSYNTNATVASERHEELWKNFLQIHLDVSIDAVGELNEYQRRGSNWETTKQVLKHFKSLKNKPDSRVRCVRVHPAVTTETLPTLYELDEFLHRLRVDVAWGNVVDNPEEFSPFKLPVERLRNLLTYNLENAKTEDFKLFMRNLLNSIENA